MRNPLSLPDARPIGRTPTGPTGTAAGTAVTQTTSRARSEVHTRVHHSQRARGKGSYRMTGVRG
ncbi:hypothetical protein PJP10_32930, partial [Mycobacterium kansasii]